MSEASDRAEHLRAQRPIHDWVRRFRQLAKEMPPEVWVYVASSTPHVMAYDANGRMFEHPKHDGTDQGAIVATVRGGRWDGGDW